MLPSSMSAIEVGFVHLIKEMYGVLALVVPVNEDIKVIAVFGRYGDKLLVAAEIVYKGRVPVRGKGFFLFGFLVDNAAVVGRRPVPPGSVQKR